MGFLPGILLAMAVLLGALVSTPHARSERLGVILLHGKMGAPSDPATGLAAIARALEAEGMLVALPSMPWDARWPGIETDVPDSLRRIDSLVGALRARGAARIALVGHSLGANVGLAYAVSRGGLAALVMAAPGHRPNAMAQRNPALRQAVEVARQKVEAGRGSEPFTGPDGIQGAALTMHTSAEVYLSWLDPLGLAAMAVQAPRLPESIPLLVVIARRDPFYREAEAELFRPAARNPYSRYLPVGGAHSETPLTGAAPIQAWLYGLP